MAKNIVVITDWESSKPKALIGYRWLQDAINAYTKEVVLGDLQKNHNPEELMDIIKQMCSEYEHLSIKPATLLINTLLVRSIEEYYKIKFDKNSRLFGMVVDHSYEYPEGRIIIKPER